MAVDFLIVKKMNNSLYMYFDLVVRGRTHFRRLILSFSLLYYIIHFPCPLDFGFQPNLPALLHVCVMKVAKKG